MRQAMRTPRRPGRWAAAVAAGAAAALVLAGCSGSPQTTPTQDADRVVEPRTAEPGKAQSTDVPEQVSIGLLGQIASLDPTQHVEAGIYSNTAMLEPLLRIDENGDLQPWLAEGFEQISDTVWEYTLREGVKFWDGAELTADDVAFSWMRLVNKEATNNQFFSVIDTVEAVDDHLVRVTLKEPNASWEFTPALVYSVVYQRAHYEASAESYGQPGGLVMGTGAYTIDSFDPTTGLELSANPDYWGGEPPIARLSFKSFADDNSMGLALRAGEIDLAPMVGDPAGFDAAAGGNSVTTVPTCSTAFVSMPTMTAPFDDVHVRRAVAHTLNRDDVIAATNGRAGAPTDVMISPMVLQNLGTEAGVDAVLDALPSYDLDLDAARAELAQSSQPDGFETEIIVDAAHATVAQVMAAQLAEVGIDVTVTTAGPVEYAALITGPEETRPFTFLEVGACTPDPSWNNLFFTSGPGLNLAAWSSPEVDQLLADALLTTDGAERLSLYGELLQKVGDEVPYVPIYAEGRSYGSKDLAIAGYDSFFIHMPWELNIVRNG